MLPVRARHLAAQPRRRDHLARVGDPVRVEGAAQPLERLEVALGEHLRHRAGLVDADAVLAGERAARVEAGAEDRLGQDLRGLRLALRRVVEDERVQVAVTRVEDVPDPEAVLARELADPPQHLGQLRPRHDAVLHVVVGRHPAHRRERALAAEPEQRALGVVARHAHLERAARAADSVDRGRVLLDLHGDAVELDEQERLGSLRVAGVVGLLGGDDREAVHHLDRGRQDSRRDDRPRRPRRPRRSTGTPPAGS